MTENPNRTRDHLANERTFLAWIRTAISLMGFGFVIVKFAVFIRQAALMLADKAPPMPKTYSAHIGVAMVLAGALTALLGYVSYVRTARNIDKDKYELKPSVNLFVAILLILTSALLVYFLLPNL